MVIPEDVMLYLLGSSSCPPLSFHTVRHARPGYNHAFLFDCIAPPRVQYYSADMFKAACKQRLRINLSVYFGDLSDGEDDRLDAHTFTKVRHVGSPLGCGILLPLNTQRHWSFDVNIGRDVPWDVRKSTVVWRGSTTGSGLRRDFVHALSKRGHDVAFDKVVQGKHDWITRSDMLRPPLTLSQQLQHRYLLSLPGNDVASGLKWNLISGSVVIMPTPRKETWLMEGRLKPWVHYIPCENHDELEDRIAWLRRNDDRARNITRAARDFVLQARKMIPYAYEVVDAALKRSSV